MCNVTAADVTESMAGELLWKLVKDQPSYTQVSKVIAGKSANSPKMQTSGKPFRACSNGSAAATLCFARQTHETKCQTAVFELPTPETKTIYKIRNRMDHSRPVPSPTADIT